MTQVLNALMEQVFQWRVLGKKMVFTNGCFDLLHAGHVRYLEQAKALGDVLIVGINSDASVARLKGEKRPIVGEQHRGEIVCALRCVDAITIFEQDTPLDLIRLIRPDVYVKGGDYTKETLPEYPVVTQYGGEVLILDFVQGCSTSQLIATIGQLYC